MTTVPSLERVAILGTGNMGTAIISGLVSSKTLSPQSIWASDTAPGKLNQLASQFGVSTTSDNRVLVKESKVIILAVKPQILSQVLEQIAGDITAEHLIISIAAGVTLATLEAAFPTARVIRTMPNTPAMTLAAVTAIARGKRASMEDLRLARHLFETIGRVVEIDESLLDAVTGLSGSGPAYVLLAIEALADGGVRMGLARPTALLLAAQTVYGTAKMVLESGEHPAKLRDAVTSPGGTTIAGVCALEEHGVRHGFIEAVKAATIRSVELGQLTKQ